MIRITGLSRRTQLWLGAALAALSATMLLGPVASGARSSLGPGCDSTRLVGSWHPGAKSSRHVPLATCLTYTHAGYGESWMIVTPSFRTREGSTVPSAVMRGGSYPDAPTANLPSFGVARSIDRGAHWANLQFGGNATEPFNRCGSDPGFYRDPVTNRTFWYGDGSCVEASYVAGAMNIAFSDDGGESWRDFANPMNFWPDIFDAAHMLGAPPRFQRDYARIVDNGYVGRDGKVGNIIYFCGGTTCYPSFDGGDTFDTSRKSDVKALAAGQKDGVLYTLSDNQLQVSLDEGASYRDRGKPIPSALTTHCTRAGGAGPLWVDNANNIYVAGTVNDKLAVTYSRDGGRSWAKPIVVQMPEVTGLGTAPMGEPMCAFAIDPTRPGHIALGYTGMTAKTPPPAEHGYLVTTYNLFAENPTFTGGQVDYDKKPLLPAGPPTMAGGAGTPPHSVSRFDFMGAYISPVDGSPWASFAWDRCSQVDCADHPDSNVTSNRNAQRNYFWTGYMGAVATMVPTKG